MQHRNGIGLHWAKTVLNHGYESDNKNPMITKAKVWNQKAQVFEEIEIQLGLTKSREKSIRWNGSKVVK